MDCNEARPLLDANADHELPAPDAQRVQQHIESCDACRRRCGPVSSRDCLERTMPSPRRRLRPARPLNRRHVSGAGLRGSIAG